MEVRALSFSLRSPPLPLSRERELTWTCERWCFYINLPIGGISILILLAFFRTPPQAKPQSAPLLEKFLQMDPVGTALVMAGILTYILALQYGGVAYPWNSSMVIGLIVGFIAIFLAFAVWEYFQGRARHGSAPAHLQPRRLGQLALSP